MGGKCLLPGRDIDEMQTQPWAHSRLQKMDRVLERINARKMVRLSKSNHICFASLGRYLYRHSKLSCEPCEEGMFQVFHDLLRETFCCTDNDRCNDPDQIIDTTKGYVSLEQDRQ